KNARAVIVRIADPAVMAAVTVEVAAKAVATVARVGMADGMAGATVAHAPSAMKAEKAAATPTTFRLF
ncbi:MAG: hypothetical protein ACRETL_04305, partial [Gammaproteobacteria bacterium]